MSTGHPVLGPSLSFFHVISREFYWKWSSNDRNWYHYGMLVCVRRWLYPPRHRLPFYHFLLLHGFRISQRWEFMLLLFAFFCCCFLIFFLNVCTAMSVHKVICIYMAFWFLEMYQRFSTSLPSLSIFYWPIVFARLLPTASYLHI